MNGFEINKIIAAIIFTVLVVFGIDKITDLIFESKIIAEDGLLIYEHYKDYELPNQYTDFKKVRDKKYGDSRLSIFKLGEKTND